MWECPKRCGRKIDEANADMIIDHIEVCDHSEATAIVLADAQERAEKVRAEVLRLVQHNRIFMEQFYRGVDTEPIAMDIDRQGVYVYLLIEALAKGKPLPN